MNDENACPFDSSTEYSDPTVIKGDVDVEEWWRIEDGQLLITWYSPIVWTKRIEIRRLFSIFYMHQKNKPCMKIKGWGLTFSPVWWACDLSRPFRRKTHYNVMIQEHENDFIYKGFTVKNIDYFLQAIKQYLPPTATIYNEFPF